MFLQRCRSSNAYIYAYCLRKLSIKKKKCIGKRTYVPSQQPRMCWKDFRYHQWNISRSAVVSVVFLQVRKISSSFVPPARQWSQPMSLIPFESNLVALIMYLIVSHNAIRSSASLMTVKMAKRTEYSPPWAGVMKTMSSRAQHSTPPTITSAMLLLVLRFTFVGAHANRVDINDGNITLNWLAKTKLT